MKKLDKFEIITVWVTFNPAIRNSQPVFRWIIFEIWFSDSRNLNPEVFMSAQDFRNSKFYFRLSFFILYLLEKSYQEQKKTYSSKSWILQTLFWLE